MRTMRADDIALGLQLCRHAGWNQLEADWKRLLAIEPDGVFVAEQDGQPCGTASTTCYGKEIAWIGMVLVHPDFRSRGIGSALMTRCIEYLRARRIRSIKLDATDLGRPVYLKLGFKDEQPIWRFAGPKSQRAHPQAEVGALQDKHWSAIARLDDQAFGADRLELLKLFARDGLSAVVEASDGVQAYGFARTGFHASFVGPVVATRPQAARSVVESLLADLPEGNIFWDILPDNTAAAQLAESLGFAVARRLMRMYLGRRAHPGETNMVYGAAGFEVG